MMLGVKKKNEKESHCQVIKEFNKWQCDKISFKVDEWKTRWKILVFGCWNCFWSIIIDNLLSNYKMTEWLNEMNF